VCFRHREGDEFSERLLARLNQGGELHLTHTKLADRYTLRMAIGGTWTERRHVESAWRTIVEVASDLKR
jgi:aromatic-L-amino-acid decarboxylase